MTKTELIKVVAKKSEISQKDTDKVLNNFFDTVKETVKDGEKVAVIGFGNFEARERASRIGVNPKTRKKMKGWTLKAKGEVLERLEDVKEVNEKIYNEVIDEVGKQYKAAKKIDAKDVDKLTSELKKHWKSIQKEYGTAAKKVAKKTVTKAAKKVAKK